MYCAVVIYASFTHVINSSTTLSFSLIPFFTIFLPSSPQNISVFLSNLQGSETLRLWSLDGDNSCRYSAFTKQARKVVKVSTCFSCSLWTKVFWPNNNNNYSSIVHCHNCVTKVYCLDSLLTHVLDDFNHQ